MVLSGQNIPSVSVGDKIRVKTTDNRIKGTITKITREQSSKIYCLRSPTGKPYTVYSDITQVYVSEVSSTVTEIIKIN